MKPTSEILERIEKCSSEHKDGVFTRLYRYLLREDIYYAAYQKLYERMMTRRLEGGRETSRPPSLPHNHPCYGCGSYGSPCVGICHREMERWLKERKRKK